MAKLVILNQGMAGRAYDLKAGRNTLGRLEDNSFEIPDGSVSSHHAEIHWQEGAKEVLFRDIGSTNGSFFNNEKTEEAVLKHGQIIRLGSVEVVFDDGSGAPLPKASPAPAAPAPTPAPAPTKASAPKNTTPTGVSMTDLEQGTGRPAFDTSTVFQKKKNKAALWYWVGAGVFALIIVILILINFSQIKGH